MKPLDIYLFLTFVKGTSPKKKKSSPPVANTSPANFYRSRTATKGFYTLPLSAEMTVDIL